MATKKQDDKNWIVRDVSPETRRLAKVYAAEHSLKLADALAELINAGYKALNKSS